MSHLPTAPAPRRGHFRPALMAVVASAVLAGCFGGGDSATSSATPAPAPTPASASLLTGVAATGAALPNANVSVTDGTGTSPCVEATITTTSTGAYTCTLQAGRTAPFFVVVTDPSGVIAPLVSVSTSTPAAGAALTVNATPLTTAIVAQLASDGNPLSVVSAKAVDATQLQAVKTNVLAQIAPVLSTIGGLANYDPFTTSITAATAAAAGNTADMVLDVVKIVTDPGTGKLALTTIDNPTPVVLASATSSGSALPAPSAGVTTLAQALQITAAKFEGCFALPVSQRVTGTNTSIPANQGGPDVTDVAPACQDFVADTGNAAGFDYLHNGYSAGQQFYGLLTSSSMTGAKFSAPEVMAFYPGVNGATGLAARDRAVVNLRYLDAAGEPGNVITVAARLPNTSSSTRPTDWWLVGNQQNVDTAVRLNIRRVEQLGTTTNQGRVSTFQSGIQFTINPNGPGSVQSENGSPITMTFARVTGPGLPAAGLMYRRSTDGALPYMDLYSKAGALPDGTPATAGCGNASTTNCPNVWFARTAGITGTAATTLATTVPAGLLWAQAGDGFNPALVVKGAQYLIEIWYGDHNNLSDPDLRVTKTLLTDAVPATQAVNLPWHTAGAQTLAALDPNGNLTGAQSALTLDWLVNPAAQAVAGAQSNNTGAGFNPSKAVPRGATSVVVNNVPAFSNTVPSNSRTVLFSYRMSDGSSKTAVYMRN